MFRAPVGGCRNADPNSGGSLFFVFFLPAALQKAPHSRLMPSLMTESPKSQNLASVGVDRERLSAVIDPVVRGHGAELVDVELKNESGWILRVYVEKQGAEAEKMTTKQAAIDLELCSNIARDLSTALDVADPIPHRYSLEVSSPGVERPLKTAADYARFVGEKAKLKLRQGVGEQKVIVGHLGPLKDGVVDVVDGGKTWNVALDEVVSARLVFEFGPAPKPKGGGKKKS